jgi:hypothetical protein
MHRASPACPRGIGLATWLAVGALGMCLLLASSGLANSRLEDIADRGVALEVPSSYRGQTAAPLAGIEQLRVQPDQPARVLIDERSGIIVMGAGVRISHVVLAQGNLTVRSPKRRRSPSPIRSPRGDTVVVPQTRGEVEESGGDPALLEQGVVARAAGRRPQCARRRTTRPDRHPAGDQGGALQAEIVGM